MERAGVERLTATNSSHQTVELLTTLSARSNPVLYYIILFSFNVMLCYVMLCYILFHFGLFYFDLPRICSKAEV